ncbi:MAG TPA: amidohydrolase family protein [Actinophytocola sp.]|uniref:amidohydrolase family protein n=1 Tax=Actinophytocola sp. TaxID=1872138 RepID=UPI002DDD72F9|nr:amidohydrolase family protein [Actinophytocola sp.]HEV2781220.1 amidohydrolase family protein [Actinophytocola sp.]
MATGRLLVRGGDVIDTEPEPVLRPATDVLVEDGRIAAVGPDLPADGAEIIDATDRLVLPGLVDTHRHVWQAALRAVAVDDDLGAYLQRVLFGLGPRMRPQDVRVSNLAGALECLDSGVTTVQDFSHIQHGPEHTDAGVDALRESGIRAVFGYGYPIQEEAGRRPDEVRRVRERFDGGLLTMALAPVGPAYAPIEVVEQDWRLAEELALPIVVHIGSGPAAERPIEALRQRGLLRADTLYVHGNSLPDGELRLIADSGAAVSITPAVEAQMGHGPPMINRLRAAGITTGLGVDVVTTVAGDMFSVMRAALLTSQLGEGERWRAAGMLRLATLDGARALGLGDRIGSLRPGKQADIVLVRADAPNLLAAHDPIGAVVTAAHPGNVDTVLVAGRVVKRDGRLLHAVPADELRRSAEHVVRA